MKNPLGPITNTISLLKEMEADDSKKELLTMLERNTEYLKNLVIRTIEYTKVSSTDPLLNLRRINLLKSIEKIIAIKKSQLDKKHISIEIDVKNNFFIKADLLYFEELLINIIENAILYNKENGKIIIKSEKNNNYIKTSIRDTGCGLESDQINKVFDEFYKVDKSRHVFYSSGLGLTIAKRIVELHNGKIWIQSKGKDKGITVHFTLPTFDTS